jgi:hypothetical protein
LLTDIQLLLLCADICNINERKNDMELEELRKQKVQEFKKAYEKEFQEPISDGEADIKFDMLVNLLHTIIYGASDNGGDDQSHSDSERIS